MRLDLALNRTHWPKAFWVADTGRGVGRTAVLMYTYAFNIDYYYCVEITGESGTVDQSSRRLSCHQSMVRLVTCTQMRRHLWTPTRRDGGVTPAERITLPTLSIQKVYSLENGRKASTEAQRQALRR